MRPELNVAATLARLAAEVADLRARVEVLEAGRRPTDRLSRADRERLAAILPTIAAELGSEPFVISELAGPGVALACANLSRRSVGKLFHRGEGVNIAGFVIDRIGNEHGCVLWQVRRVVSDAEKPAKTTRDASSVRARAAS
jgi:hypothetical protein